MRILRTLTDCWDFGLDPEAWAFEVNLDDKRWWMLRNQEGDLVQEAMVSEDLDIEAAFDEFYEAWGK